jgi:hypothetical protein
MIVPVIVCCSGPNLVVVSMRSVACVVCHDMRPPWRVFLCIEGAGEQEAAKSWKRLSTCFGGLAGSVRELRLP